MKTEMAKYRRSYKNGFDQTATEFGERKVYTVTRAEYEEMKGEYMIAFIKRTETSEFLFENWDNTSQYASLNMKYGELFFHDSLDENLKIKDEIIFEEE